jgi:cytochrome oxidase assembly protein ShyY1
VYRFLLRPKWLGGLALAIAAAVVMVFLGIWQWHRYEERSAVNNRIDAADTVAPLPPTSVMSAPTRPGTAGHSPGDDRAWTKVTVTGRYDPAHEIQVRGRTVNGDVGFEIVTPLIRNDGSAVLIDRGWLPQGGDALAAPQVPPAPTGQVTVVGQIHLSESRPTPVQHRDGRLDTRRISVPRLAHSLPYPVYGAYVLLTSQTPTASPQFTPIPIDHEDAWQNAGYTVQWWLFAAMALVAFGWQARKEARGENPPPKSAVKPGAASLKPGLDRVVQSDLDRVAESDRLAAARAVQRANPPPDRVTHSDHRAAEQTDPTMDRVAESGRRAAKRAAKADRPMDRVAESDLKAAQRAARSSRRSD